LMNRAVVSLEQLVERLRQASEDLKRAFGSGFAGLVLFGSYARGEAVEGSDVDLLLVLRGLKGLAVRAEAYSIISRRVGKPLTLVDIDVDELSREDLEVTPLLLNILYDGVIVYDELGILRRLKERVAKLVERAQLVRYRTPDGKYGWKRADDRPLEVVKI